MNLKKNKSGFTLLEIIIVIIIVGILASIALPKFFKTVEFSRAQEALTSLGTVRLSMERCYLYTRTYTPCSSFGNLDMLDPGATVNPHWSYTFPILTATGFGLTATRLTLDGGTAGDAITLDQSGVKTGSGNFTSIR